MSPAASECSTRSWTSVSMRAEPVGPRIAISSTGRSSGASTPARTRVVDVVVDVGDPVHQPDDLALERGGLARAAGVAQDAVAHRLGQVQALEHVDHPQRVLVVAEAAAEALAPGAVEHVLADVAERRVPDVVPEPDRLRQVLVEPQRPRDRPADPGDLERVREPRAVVVALGRDEHLRLVLEAPERLAVHDPVAVALERRPQAAVGLRALAPGGVGRRRQRVTATRLHAPAGRRRSRSTVSGGAVTPPF